jgi:pyruvate kinase
MNHSPSQTNIIATIGPSSRKIDTIVDMIHAGMDMARLNFSHGSYDDHALLIKHIRKASSIAERNIPIIQDLSGPRVSDTHGHHMNSEYEVITQKDKEDLRFGIEHKVDYIAQSFVKDSNDILTLKELVASYKATTPVIAKIERKEALDNIREIIKVSDAIMIARGDLGDNMPLEEIPYIERDIINLCKEHQTPVITATEMMYSMIHNTRPTRAEVTDVAYAVTLGTNSVMLSDETAIGSYPVETITFMERIICAAEEQRV